MPFYNSDSFLSMDIESCESNHCQNGIQVYFGTETQYFHTPLYGHYELQLDPVNDKPYFKMDIYGLWWVNGYWFIGWDSNKGKMVGYAYYHKNVYCPSQLSELDWSIWDGSAWIDAGNNLGITCILASCVTFDGPATCLNEIGVQCTHYDSSTGPSINDVIHILRF